MYLAKRLSIGSRYSYLLPIAILLCAFIAIACSYSSLTTSTQEAVQYETITYRDQQFDIVRVDLRQQAIQLYWRDAAGKPLRSLRKLHNHFAQSGKTLQFGMNAGMYMKDGSPQGLYIEDGKTIKKIIRQKEGYGNFFLQPNGVFYLNADTAGVLTTTAYLTQNIKAQYASQSGPMLVIDNELHPVFVEGSKNLNIRNGVGRISPHELVFVISHKKVNLYDFAMLFKEALHCPNALYLDGFVSKAYIPSLERKQLGGNFGVMIGF